MSKFLIGMYMYIIDICFLSMMKYNNYYMFGENHDNCMNITKLHQRAVLNKVIHSLYYGCMAALVFSHYCFILAAICHCVLYLYLQ